MKKFIKILKLIPRIAVNLVLIFWDWLMEKMGRRKKLSLIIGAVLLLAILAGGGIWGWKKYKLAKDPANQPQIYEALVMVKDKTAKDPVEDARSSLKKNDVIAYFPEGHPWSETEKISYLIVKLKLTSDEAGKLTEAETKESEQPKNQPKEQENIPEKNMSGQVKKQPEARDMGPRMETIRARKYTLDLPGYDLQKFWESHEQPFGDKVFSASVIDKK